MKTASKYSLILIFSLTISLFSGSCIFPVYVPSSESTSIDMSNIKPGVTTKEDVFLAYGHAFRVSDDEKLFTLMYYQMGDFAWVYFVGAGYGGTGGIFGERKINNMYEVEIEFDENDVVKRCEAFKLPRDKSPENK